MIIIPNWPKNEEGVETTVCFMCSNRGITHYLPGLAAGYCGPCFKAGYYTFQGVEEE